MFKISDLVVAGIATAVLTLGFAAAQARDVKPAPAPASVSVDAPSAPASQERTELGQATAEKIVEVAPCAKKVKVVYAGYGEADRACTGR